MDNWFDEVWDEIDPHPWGVHYYDRQGNPITMRQWCDLRHDPADIIVKKTLLTLPEGEAEVSTVWLGLDHGFSLDPHAPPMIFETMIFAQEVRRIPEDSPFFPGFEYYEDLFDYQARYSTEELALKDHERVVALLSTRIPSTPGEALKRGNESE